MIDLGGFVGFPALQQYARAVEGPSRSYAAVARSVLPNVENLPSPVRDSSLTRIKIPQEAYTKQLEMLKYALLGRLNFGHTTLDRLRDSAKGWGLKNGVFMKSLGKGFVVFRFLSEEDMTSTWKRSSLRVDGQLLRFQRWKKDFNVDDQAITHRLTWVCFPNLQPQEYWHEEVLLSIAKAVGRPIAIDRCTKNSFYGHFARVCVDIDDSAPRVEEVYVEREQEGSHENFVFKQRVVFENPPSRCACCRRYGHNVEACPTKAQVQPAKEEIPGANYVDQPAQVRRQQQGWRRREGPAAAEEVVNGNNENVLQLDKDTVAQPADLAPLLGDTQPVNAVIQARISDEPANSDSVLVSSRLLM
ncbi:uncharacterized protein LOC122645028 [Telopea speciosissima]|uniref:uncharacterized protein LOC122645028 n=1 Tax=Telopea speciosissima TaxID=54955 RepID=UPI001CC7519F|nr:uncharacterized protein LOC122645028 [Telopea speciosissima]